MLERAEHASSFALKVSTQNMRIKIYDGNKLLDGKGWDFIKDFPFQNAKAKVAFIPARVWERDGKAGVASEATMLVLQAGEHRAKMEDCFLLGRYIVCLLHACVSWTVCPHMPQKSVRCM